MPLEALLMMGYQATAMGKMPILDDAGKPTGKYDIVEGPERFKFWSKLMDKSMPSAPVKEEELPKERITMKEAEMYEDEESLAMLDDEELRQIAALPYNPEGKESSDPWA